MFGALDPAKLLVILVLALVVLGPERLPRAARQLGGAWRELTRLRDQVTEEVRSAIPDLDLPDIPRHPSGAISSFLRDLTASPAAHVELDTDDAATGDASSSEDPSATSATVPIPGGDLAASAARIGSAPRVAPLAGDARRPPSTRSALGRSGPGRARSEQPVAFDLAGDDPAMN